MAGRCRPTPVAFSKEKKPRRVSVVDATRCLAWQRPKRLLEDYTTALIEGSLYYNGAQLWRRTSPVNSQQRDGELLDTYPILSLGGDRVIHATELPPQPTWNERWCAAH